VLTFEAAEPGIDSLSGTESIVACPFQPESGDKRRLGVPRSAARKRFPRLRAAGEWLAVGALALLAFAWTLPLPLKQDDYTVIAAAGDWMRHLARLEGWRHDVGGASLAALFRPVLWASLVLEKRLLGEPLPPFGFHALSVLSHALVAMLVFRLSAALHGRRAAWVAAAMMAICGASGEAVGWVAARGDVLVGLFASLAALAALRGGIAGALGTGVAAALALASKESGIAVAPVAAALLAARAGLGGTAAGAVPAAGAQRRIVLVTAFLLPLAVAALLRYGATGRLLPAYVEDQLVLWSRLRTALVSPEKFLAPLRHLAAPCRAVGPVAPSWWLAAAGAIAIAAVMARPRVLVTLIVGMAATLVLALPVLAVAGADTPPPGLRHLYAALVPFSVVAGAAWSALSGPLVGRSAARTALAALLAAVLLAPGAIAAAQYAIDEREVGRRVRARLESLAALIDECPAGTTIVAIDPEIDYHGRFVLGADISRALVPPFRAAGTPIAFYRHAAQARADGRFEEPLPVRVVEVRGGRYAPLTGVLSALPATLPLLRPTDHVLLPADCGGAVFVPDSPVAPRAVQALELELAAGAAVSVTLRLITERGVYEKALDVPAGGTPTRATIVMTDDPDFVGSRELMRVAVAIAGDRRIAGAPRLLSRVPALAVIEPTDGARVRLGAGFIARLRDVPAGAHIVIEAVAGDADTFGSLSATVPAVAEGRSDADDVLVDVLGSVPDAASGAHPWRDLAALIRTHLAPFGIAAVPVRLRFLARIGPSSTTVALSPWRRILAIP
jgi:hypothetical protein